MIQNLSTYWYPFVTLLYQEISIKLNISSNEKNKNEMQIYFNFDVQLPLEKNHDRESALLVAGIVSNKTYL